MKISIFPKVIPLPSSSSEKAQASKYSLYPEEIEVYDIDQLAYEITKSAWSPSLFFDVRNKENFKKADFMVLDIDDGMTISEAENIVERMEVSAIIAPTTSHNNDHHKFRVIFPLAWTINTEKDFNATWDYLKTKFPSLDSQCSDTSRFYFACQDHPDGVVIDPPEYRLLEPKFAPIKQNRAILRDSVKAVGYEDSDLLESLYGENKEFLPKCIDFFLKEAHTGLPGKWWRSLNDFVFVLALQNVDYDVVYSIVERLAPEPLDENDERTIDYAYKDGEEMRQEDL